MRKCSKCGSTSGLVPMSYNGADTNGESNFGRFICKQCVFNYRADTSVVRYTKVHKQVTLLALETGQHPMILGRAILRRVKARFRGESVIFSKDSSLMVNEMANAARLLLSKRGKKTKEEKIGSCVLEIIMGHEYQ